MAIYTSIVESTRTATIAMAKRVWTSGWSTLSMTDKVVVEKRERSIPIHYIDSSMPVNWEAQREMDRDVEEHADLYEVLADESDDE